MSERLIQIELDYDRTFFKVKAEKRDGFARTDEGAATAITNNAIFPLAAPVVFRDIADYLNASTPPAFLGQAPAAFLKFRNDWQPIAHPALESPEDRADRARREAVAATRMGRQSAIQESNAIQSRHVSESFRILAIAMGAMGVIGVVLVGLLVLTKGVPA